MDTYCPYCMSPAQLNEPCPCCKKIPASYQPAMHHFPPGRLLHERYLLGRLLGSGGFGNTYLGWDTVLQYRVAIKEYFPNQLVRRDASVSMEVTCNTDADKTLYDNGRRRFLEEARVMAGLQNIREIVRVTDFFRDNNTAYIVMEYLEGETLKAIIDSQKRIAAPDLLKLMEPVMRAMETMHRAGIIHRDISPDNMMVMPDGCIKLMDFGCAKDYSAGGTMTVMLKHGYTPPEQYDGYNQGPWTDVYALCATMYRCLTGNMPPKAYERVGRNDPLIPPNKKGAALTDSQEQALLKGLAVPPEERWQSVSGLYAPMYGRTMGGLFPKPPQPVKEENTEIVYQDPPPGSQTMQLESNAKPAASEHTAPPAAGPARAGTGQQEPQASSAAPESTSPPMAGPVRAETGQQKPQASPATSENASPAGAAPKSGRKCLPNLIKYGVAGVISLTVAAGGIWGFLTSAPDVPDAPEEIQAAASGLSAKELREQIEQCTAQGDFEQAFTYCLEYRGLVEDEELFADQLTHICSAATESEAYDILPPIFEELIKLGEPRGYYGLGICYEKGYGVDISETEAFQYYLKAAQEGIPDKFSYALVKYYEEGIGTEKDPEQALYWLNRYIASGDTEFLSPTLAESWRIKLELMIPPESDEDTQMEEPAQAEPVPAQPEEAPAKPAATTAVPSKNTSSSQNNSSSQDTSSSQSKITLTPPSSSQSTTPSKYTASAESITVTPVAPITAPPMEPEPSGTYTVVSNDEPEQSEPDNVSTSVSLSTYSASLSVGESFSLFADVTPQSAASSLSWNSSDSSVATVSGGYVTAVSSGSAVIMASCGDASAMCVVSVS